MIHKRINLKEEYPFLKNDVILESFCQSNYQETGIDRKRKTMIVLPGGGYQFLSDREGAYIASRFLGYDINAFVVYYSVAPHIEFPNPLSEVYAAIDYIKKHADEYTVDVNSIGIIGFSAGGNLAGNVAAHYNDPIFMDMFKCDDKYLRVDACFLGYPVVVNDPAIAHMGSFINVSGNDKKLMDYYQFVDYVDENYPKTFIWHTCFDNCVPVQNAILLANKLAYKKVLFELHIYPDGDHGQSLANKAVYKDEYKDVLPLIEGNKGWIDRAIRFVEKYM